MSFFENLLLLPAAHLVKASQKKEGRFGPASWFQVNRPAEQGRNKRLKIAQSQQRHTRS